MRRALLLTLVLLSALPLRAQTPPPKAPAKGTTKGTAPKKRAPIIVETAEPREVEAGGLVTITGSGFDQGTAALLGSFSPRIVEVTRTRIVLQIPDDGRKDTWSAPLLLITPGLPVTNAGITMTVQPKGTLVKTSEKTTVAQPFALQAIASLTAAEEKRWTLDLRGATAVKLSVETGGGDIEVRLEPEGGKPIVRATMGGNLTAEYDVFKLHGADGKPAEKAILVIATDSATPIPVRVRVFRVERRAVEKKP